MSNIAKSILNAIGLGVLCFILVNFIFFLIAFVSADNTESWNIALKHGSFSLNDEITGLRFWSLQANLVIGGVAAIVLNYQYRKGNLIKT